VSDLSDRVDALDLQLRVLREEVRVADVADAYLASAGLDAPIGQGDVFFHNGILYRVSTVYSDGRWCVVSENGNCFEPHVAGADYFEGAERLYTAVVGRAPPPH